VSQPIVYTRGEKIALGVVAAIGFLLNAVAVYSMIFRWDWVMQAHLENPFAAVFIAEAFVLMVFWAYFLRKWGVARLGWGWFIVLSLLGSMAFAIPVVLLWPKRKGPPPLAPVDDRRRPGET
jgi:hypothetical protein